MKTPLRDDYMEVHAHRFELSERWLQPYLKPGCQVLELGGGGPFTPRLLKAGANPRATDFDLRKVWPDFPLPEGGFDLILCMEVIEHLGDPDPDGGYATEWQGWGAKEMLQSAKSCLAPGGRLFLTTPNAASITAIHHALNLAPPMIYRPHVREYAPYELDELVRSAGFEIERRETHDVWLNAIGARAHQNIRRFIRDSGYPDELRGEDIFLLTKPLAF